MAGAGPDVCAPPAPGPARRAVAGRRGQAPALCPGPARPGGADPGRLVRRGHDRGEGRAGRGWRIRGRATDPDADRRGLRRVRGRDAAAGGRGAGAGRRTAHAARGHRPGEALAARRRALAAGRPGLRRWPVATGRRAAEAARGRVRTLPAPWYRNGWPASSAWSAAPSSGRLRGILDRLIRPRGWVARNGTPPDQSRTIRNTRAA